MTIRIMLDIIGRKDVIKKNPNPILSFIKVFSIMKCFDYKASPKTVDFIANQFVELGDNIWVLVEEEYKRHYNEQISDKLESFMRHYTEEAVSDSFSRRHCKENVAGQYNIYDYFFDFSFNGKER